MIYLVVYTNFYTNFIYLDQIPIHKPLIFSLTPLNLPRIYNTRYDQNVHLRVNHNDFF